ncbi:hypothetical protein BDW62DRAFT_198628 [Aspergillus aurantiobrunneus]
MPPPMPPPMPLLRRFCAPTITVWRGESRALSLVSAVPGVVAEEVRVAAATAIQEAEDAIVGVRGDLARCRLPSWTGNRGAHGCDGHQLRQLAITSAEYGVIALKLHP